MKRRQKCIGPKCTSETKTHGGQDAKCARSAWLKLKESNGEINGEDSEERRSEGETEGCAKKGDSFDEETKGYRVSGRIAFRL